MDRNNAVSIRANVYLFFLDFVRSNQSSLSIRAMEKQHLVIATCWAAANETPSRPSYVLVT